MSACLRAELADQETVVTALIVGSVDTRMAAHVKGAKERPETVAAAALTAIRRGVAEADTDPMAIEVRAALAREPEALARGMAKLLKATEIKTGR
jgi:short-subunit dehydrogenase